MSITVMAIVLLAAVMHAGWNAIVKSGGDKFVEITLLTSGAALIALPALVFLPLPAPASWPYIAASVLIHCAYFSLVAFTYRTGDLSFAYPVMRGSAPLATALVSAVIVGERLTPGGWVGIVLLSGGILALARDNWKSRLRQGRALAFGLVNAGVIVVYTVVDGVGVRLAGNAWSYVTWMFFLNAFPLLGIALYTRRAALLKAAGNNWRNGLAGGALTLGAYGLVLWAMTQAPIALVAALRETAVIFGVIIACAVLKERFGATRWTASILVAAGAAAMKLW